MAAVTLALGCATANAQVDLSGVQIGTDDHAALVRVHPKAVCVLFSQDANDQNCVVRAAYAGVPAEITYVVADDKVVGGSAIFKPEDFDRVLQTLTQKYSKPQASNAPSAQPGNDQQRLAWTLPGMTILAIRNAGGTPPIGSIVIYETPAAANAMAKRTEARAKALQESAAKLLPEAEGARAALMNRLPSAPRDFDIVVMKSIAEVAKLLRSGAPLDQVKASLAELESRVGPLRSFPNAELQGMLAAVALLEHNAEEQRYHQAFGRALILALQRTGDGATPATAFKVISIREEYVWFSTQNGRLKPKSQALAEINGKKYDVWTVASNAGEEKVYYDVSALPHLQAR
jgi:hypothetical protein